jgi:hypothetical protein
MRNLTIKQQRFVELCVALGNNTEAYRQAYNPSKPYSNYVRIEACRLSKKLKEQINDYKITGEIKYKIQPKKLDGYVYLLDINILDIEGLEYYKIGSSNNPHSRLKYLQTAMPFEINLVRKIYVDNRKLVEKKIHEKLKDYRFKGEWFECNLDLINKVFDEF